MIMSTISTLILAIFLILWGQALYLLGKYLIEETRTFKHTIYTYISISASLVFLLPAFLYVPPVYIFPYVLFISALIVTINTDIEHMLISRYVTLFLIPLAFIFSYYNFLPISLVTSLMGAVSAYGFLFIISYIYLKITGLHGLGLGDIELLAFIGAWLGIRGWWFALCSGACVGSIIGLALAFFLKTSLRTTKLPFGPFLACGAIAYVYLQWYIAFPFFIQ